MAVEVGQKYEYSSDKRPAEIVAVGSEGAIVKFGDESEGYRHFNWIKSWTLIKPFFRLGATYKRKGSASTYKVQSLYQNGDQIFAVLFWSNPITGKDGITGEYPPDFEHFEEIS